MYKSYVIGIRRELHQYPEIGFNLPNTLRIIKRELDEMGVDYSENYGKSSIVATISASRLTYKTILVRADIDALPIEEVNDVPYRSHIKGQMHACGHDAHTAVLLATIEELIAQKDRLNCNVKCVFQASEESIPSGAKLMIEDGVLDGVDTVLSFHCDPNKKVGSLGITEGYQNAISDTFILEFYGIAGHMAHPKGSINALKAATKAYCKIYDFVDSQVAKGQEIFFNIGKINGGTAQNIIPEKCTMLCALRTHDKAIESMVLNEIDGICTNSASSYGGKYKFNMLKQHPMVYNEPIVTKRFRQVAESVIGAENIVEHPQTMEGEDFSFFTEQKAGCMYRIGVRNENKNIINDLHHNNFDIDEESLEIAVNVNVNYILGLQL